jgi:tellurite resistance protein
MSSGDSFQNRGDALENEFFRKVDQELMERLQKQGDIESLRECLGIRDDKVAASLLAAGVTVRTATALRLVPLVAVAWADGRIEASEREVILSAAEKHGITPQSPGGQLLRGWLDQKPSLEMMDTWVAYAGRLAEKLTPQESAHLRQVIVEEMQQVAEASGGFLGFAAVSSGESNIIKRIEAALSHTA